jgi:hypothetical protein
MIEILQGFDFHLQRLNHCALPSIILVAHSTRHLDLLDGNHLTRSHVQSQINPPIGTFPYEFSSNPFERCCNNVISEFVQCNQCRLTRSARRRLRQGRYCGLPLRLQCGDFLQFASPQLGAPFPHHVGIGALPPTGSINQSLMLFSNNSNRFLGPHPTRVFLSTRRQHCRCSRRRQDRGRLSCGRRSAP